MAALRKLGHDAWTAAEAGLNTAADDELTVYAMDRQAVLVTHNREFSIRRQRNVIGWHIWLGCAEWEAAGLLGRHIDELVGILESSPDVWIQVSADGYHLSRHWD